MAGIKKNYKVELMDMDIAKWRDIMRNNHKQFAEMLLEADINAIDYKKLSDKAHTIFMLNMILLEKLEETQTK